MHFNLLNMKQNKILSKFIYILLATGALLILIFSTDPNNSPLPVLVVPFIIIGYLFYQTSRLLLLIARPHMNKQAVIIFPLSIAFTVVSLLILGSLRQLTWSDSLLVLGFTALLGVYLSRVDFFGPKT